MKTSDRERFPNVLFAPSPTHFRMYQALVSPTSLTHWTRRKLGQAINLPGLRPSDSQECNLHVFRAARPSASGPPAQTLHVRIRAMHRKQGRSAIGSATLERPCGANVGDGGIGVARSRTVETSGRYRFVAGATLAESKSSLIRQAEFVARYFLQARNPQSPNLRIEFNCSQNFKKIKR